MILEVISNYLPLSGLKAVCPFHLEKTGSLTVYPRTESFYCYGCGEGGDAFLFVSKIEDCSKSKAVAKVAEILGVTKEEALAMKENIAPPAAAAQAPRLDKEVQARLFAETGYESFEYRGIRDEFNKFYGHRTALDENNNVIARYYPETNEDGQLTGYKCRNHPKDFSFGKLGSTGMKSQLSGQVKFTGGGKYVLIVGGEEDKVAAYQMLFDNQKDKDFIGIPVVSPTSGENSAAKQCAAQYDFLDSFEVIIIGMDNDKVGMKAALEIAAVLPRHKVRIATWTEKDPNYMLEHGMEKQFCRDFWNAKEFIASGIQNSANIMPSVIEELLRPRLTLPPYMHRMQAAMGGGPRQGIIMNIIGDTSIGKSTFANGLVYHWMFHAPEKVGVVSLEATAGQYGLDMLSLHLETNFMWSGNGSAAEVAKYLESEEGIRRAEDLWVNEYGEPRWAILDERDGDVKNLERQIERLIHQYGCRIIVVDVLTDILRGLGSDAQEEHMKWQKKIIKDGITITNVLHTRKPPPDPSGKMRKVTEYDALGTSSFVQSAAINIVINRDKMAEGIEKNITDVDMPKCRGGITGPVGQWYYDWKTRQIYDYQDWLRIQSGGDKPATEENL